MHKMEVNSKVGLKLEGWSLNFHEWKGIWIYKRSLNRFPFQRKAPKKKVVVVKDENEKGDLKKKLAHMACISY